MAASSSSSSSHEDQSFSKMDEKDPSLIGSHCQYTYCNQLDFLPFRCESCSHTFCLDHRSESAHRCARAGEWAARKRQQAASPAGSGAARNTLASSAPRPCASPACKTVIGTSLTPDVHCAGCKRDYCLKHRLKEDHDCKNLVPIGPRPAGSGGMAAPAEKARWALGKLRAWGAAQKEALAATGARSLPTARPSTASARLVALNALKKTAKGDATVAAEKRVYLYVEAEAATTTAKYPRGAFFYSKDWVVGRLLDAAARSLQVQNVNNRSTEETDKLRVFHVEGGRLLEFGEKVGGAVVSGNTLVLLRGVGPANDDLIDLRAA